MTKFPREVTHMNFTNPRAEKSRSQSKNNQENQFRISYTATGQELIYGYVPVGIDLAGRKFQVCFYNEDNELVNTTFDIYALRRFIASTHQKLLISMEGCTGSSYWANYAITHGHKAVVLDARAIKNRKAQKDDFNDAFFIREALFTHHQTCRIRTQEEIDLKSFYVQREQYIKSLNAVCSNVRQRLIAAGAYEHVVTGADSALLAIKYYKKQINNKADVGSSSLTLKTLDSFVEDINYLTQKIDRINQDIIDAKARESQVAKQLMTIPGIGPQLALLLSLDISDISRFKTARALQAYFGLFTAHSGSGGKIEMGKMSRNGDPVVKRMLYQAVLTLLHCGNKIQIAPRSEYIQRMYSRNKVAFKRGVISICAKIIRVVFGVLHHGTAYDPQIDDSLGNKKARIHAYSNRCLTKVSADALLQELYGYTEATLD